MIPCPDGQQHQSGSSKPCGTQGESIRSFKRTAGDATSINQALSARQPLNAALATMKDLLLLAALANTACPVSQYESAALSASAHLEEEAEINGAPESRIGAYLILWHIASCDKLNDDEGDLTDSEREELASSCTHIVHFPQASEPDYVTSSQAHISERTADFATLVWAEKSGLLGKQRHTVIIADNDSALKLTFAGYGRDGKIGKACMPTPWTFPKPASG